MAFSSLLKSLSLLSFFLLAASVRGSVATVAELQPPPGNTEIRAFEVSHGFQIYQCAVDSGSANLSWIHSGSVGTLVVDADDHFNITHYFQSHPDANGGRATWTYSESDPDARDNVISTVTARVVVSVPDKDPSNVDSQLLEASSHSGNYPGDISLTSYIQIRHPRGGAPPPADECTFLTIGRLRNVPYNATYAFFEQDDEPPKALIPAGISVPADSSSHPLFKYFATGSVQYRFTGKSWEAIETIPVFLSSLPGSPTVAVSQGPDLELQGALWKTFFPREGRGEAKLVGSATVDPSAIDWLLFKVTSQDWTVNGTVTYFQRLSTRGGLPPTTPVTVGEVTSTPFTAIYWFYGWW